MSLMLAAMGLAFAAVLHDRRAGRAVSAIAAEALRCIADEIYLTAELWLLAAMREAAEVKQSCVDVINSLGEEWESGPLTEQAGTA